MAISGFLVTPAPTAAAAAVAVAMLVLAIAPTTTLAQCTIEQEDKCDPLAQCASTREQPYFQCTCPKYFAGDGLVSGTKCTEQRCPLPTQPIAGTQYIDSYPANVQFPGGSYLAYQCKPNYRSAPASNPVQYLQCVGGNWVHASLPHQETSRVALQCTPCTGSIANGAVSGNGTGRCNSGLYYYPVPSSTSCNLGSCKVTYEPITLQLGGYLSAYALSSSTPTKQPFNTALATCKTYLPGKEHFTAITGSLQRMVNAIGTRLGLRTVDIWMVQMSKDTAMPYYAHGVVGGNVRDLKLVNGASTPILVAFPVCVKNM